MPKINVLLWLGLSAIFFNCSRVPNRSVAPAGLLHQLRVVAGYEIPGEVIYPAGREAPFQGIEIWTKIKMVGKDRIELPICLGQEKIYRTLILTRGDHGIHLQHENKRPTGQQAEISMYGGLATGLDSEYLLIFPADSYSKQLLGPLRENVWSLALNNEKTILSYISEENGHITMQIDFDLTRRKQNGQPQNKSMVDHMQNLVLPQGPKISMK